MFQSGHWALLAAFATATLVAQPAHASLAFQPISQDELKMTSEPHAQGASAIILYRQVDRDDNIYTPHEDNYLRIKILTEEGRKHGNIQIPFVKELDNVVNIKARTIRPDGSISDFDGKIFEKELVKERGTELLAKVITLPDVEVGSIIEYSFTIDFVEHKLFRSNWILSNELFTKKAQFSLKPYEGRYVKYTLRWSWHDLPPGAVPKEGPDHIIRMEASDIPAFQSEDHMPPANELKSRVSFIYEEGVSPKDQVDFWKQVGKKRNDELENFIGKRKTMEQAVAEVVSANDPQDVKLRKIYDRVQQIRNKSYELRKTEQELKREKEKPIENVEDIWKRGYGSGVQLTWLFLGLARAAGFEAYGCWVSSRREYFFTPNTMENAKLNANVVLVKLNGKDLYLDPGGPFTPFGLLEWSETGVPGLRLDKDGGTWIKTSLPEASESQIEHVAKLKLSGSGDLEGKLTLTYTGLEAMYHRLEERHADNVARKKFLEERVTSQIGVAAEAELTNQPDWANSETPLVAEFNLKIPNWTANAGRKVLIPAAIFTAGERKVFEHASRVHPIYFEYPHEKVDDITIELPAGWEVNSVPPLQDHNGNVIAYTLKVEQNPGTLRLTRKLAIDVLLLDQKNYAALRNLYENVRTSDGLQIVAVPGEIHASN